MGLIERRVLIDSISPPCDNILSTQLVDEFISAERRYIQRDWEPTQLDGGQFAEISARIWYHADSGNLSPAKEFSECLRYIENDSVSHVIERRVALHVSKVLRTVYKFRSQRGAVHISPDYTPNHMDSRFVVEAIRWIFSETLRIFWRDDREAVAKVIRELMQFEVPAVGKFGGVTLVQRTDLVPEEEVLIILHFGGEGGMSRAEIGSIALCSQPSVSRVLQKLISKDMRQAILGTDGRYRLTDLGSRRISQELAPKLTL